MPPDAMGHLMREYCRQLRFIIYSRQQSGVNIDHSVGISEGIQIGIFDDFNTDLQINRRRLRLKPGNDLI